MVRIQDSQSWHRGSIPLSTTLHFKSFRINLSSSASRETSVAFFCFYIFLFFPRFTVSLYHENEISIYSAYCLALDYDVNKCQRPT